MAKRIEDLLETDDVFLGPPPAAGEFVADLPSDDSREKLAPGYLEEARRAARQGRRIAPVTARSSASSAISLSSAVTADALLLARILLAGTHPRITSEDMLLRNTRPTR